MHAGTPRRTIADELRDDEPLIIGKVNQRRHLTWVCRSNVCFRLRSWDRRLRLGLIARLIARIILRWRLRFLALATIGWWRALGVGIRTKATATLTIVVASFGLIGKAADGARPRRRDPQCNQPK